MIYGIGTDIVEVERLAEFHARHGERGLEKILAPAERREFSQATDSARFLAKRFAAKEAFGKALGLGVRAPALLPAIAVAHDALGKPCLEYSAELAAHLAARGLTAHLSLSDERNMAVAFVILEQK